MKKAYVIGLGRSGMAAARLLKQQGWNVIVSDRSTGESLLETKELLVAQGIEVNLGSLPTLETSQIDLIVVSPGVPWDSSILIEARDRGIDTIGELELAWRSLQTLPWLGITGTNGKTTTTALLAAIFQTAGIKAPPCGNIGYAACELALAPPPEWVIAEISSFQIESSRELAPQIGIWTTFTPDHLNRHGTLENYYRIKASLLKRCQHKIFNGDDPYLANLGSTEWKDAYWTSIRGKAHLIGSPETGVYLENNQIIAFGRPVLPLSAFEMIGEHNQQNLLLAVAAARLAQIEPEAIQLAVSNFKGVPHRLEYVCSVNGIKFINDSKATNYDAAVVGLKSVSSPVILIAGGEAKTGDNSDWLAMIKTKVAKVLLIGQDGPTLAENLKQSGYLDYQVVETMEKAVKAALSIATNLHTSVVLLSPACASFDQYQSFEHRGDHFRELCEGLIGD
ncbi:UDP-N-acetylmuramoyl-L-alanine--D-glutamate ligase [Gloeocapsa sp. PCC 73106]|uniref:UDP-N-acetylmuramoyl-L-alanine--D-glutamate ligase n=1 Tax=Gloeocapsa sp. PCC 73106 TaxID=102232 RepID=UPI001181BEFA|nr:UDP-N-acetylmuramoyl-L-alanine--D-glutamate ligase [Gloeocapsa sp. PCC 73106]